MTQSSTSDLLITISGTVQGVGFRWWTQGQAVQLGLTGYAKNLTNGDVEVLVHGPADTQRALLELLREQPSTARRPGDVTSVDVREIESGTVPPRFDVR